MAANTYAQLLLLLNDITGVEISIFGNTGTPEQQPATLSELLVEIKAAADRIQSKL